ncbi:capsid protein [Porprismacovirus canid3]|uniref:Capsid protein n=1 Tax=Raccoon dog stool-associated smacovirus 4 TaxID=2829092 RepID=A0AAE7UUP2_9VIRU|nr:capsid protein [Raccoon dog stool-associated smacovirus 4]
MATNFAKASFQEVYDFHTEVNNTTLVEIHTPISDLPQRMLNGFFTQFRKFRYDGCDITLVPVSTLPADPLQISYASGEPTIDPRDLVNPILFKGMTGASMGKFVDAILANASRVGTGQPLTDNPVAQDGPTAFFGDSLSIAESAVLKAITGATAALESLYYQCLSSSEWSKAGVQSGFRKRNLYPLVFKEASTVFKPYATNSAPNAGGTGTPYIPGTFPDYSEGASARGIAGWDDSATPVTSVVNPGPTFSNGATRLGWMPTQSNYTASGVGVTTPSVEGASNVTILPLIPMMLLILPPAYKTEMYFRMVIRHRFSFRDFASTVGADAFVNNSKIKPAFLYENAVTSGASVATTTSDQPELLTAGVS